MSRPETFQDRIYAEGGIESLDTITTDGGIVFRGGKGAAAGTGVTADETDGVIVHKTVITFTNAAVALTDEATVVAHGGLKVYDFPSGAICILGAVAAIDLTKSSVGVDADWNGDFGVGTAVASNNATLAATEQNIIPTTATPEADTGVTTANGQSSGTVIINGTDDDAGVAAAADVYVNLLVDDADHDVGAAACNLIMNGTLTIHWINLGNN